ncbi:MAG: AEC family transporter [Clostridia bacterium]|nr:AEC family transporter [Clostridia bacterium]
MDLLFPTINQMIFLFAFILLGYILTKSGYLPASAASILSKLENMIFIPALVLGTFIQNFTVASFSSAWKILLFSLILELVLIPICILICKACTKDKYTQKIYTYGLCFSNFGFMGNAVVAAIFPQYFAQYILFTLPLWSLIYVWGVPTLLIGGDEKKTTLKSRLKAFVNPMFICMIVGMIIGITGISTMDLPGEVLDGTRTTVLKVITVAGDCMSPVAMLLTGITLAGINLKGTLKKGSIYVVSVLRLIVFPLIAIGIFALVPCPEMLVICTVCSLAMPLGLNTIVVPSAYGKDTSTAAGMALISHLLSVLTIPVIFILLRMVLS